MEKTKDKKEYTRTVGRRKTATACVKIIPASKQTFTVNGKDAKEYFGTPDLYNIAREPFETAKIEEKFEVTSTAKGGGIHAQAEAVRHGISRALIIFDTSEEMKSKLKKAGFLKRDPRAKERRKFGLKKARKAPQWSKR
jgi:small subunit ribosomal protein S9